MRKTIFLVFFFILGASAAAECGVVFAPMPFGGGIHAKVRSMKDLRFTGVVHQKYDFSCGAAAMATLLKYYYGRKVTEQEIIKEMISNGDAGKIRSKGFSLLDMKHYAERHKFLANGYMLKSASDLQKLQLPVIVLVKTKGYNHFVLLKGARNGTAYLADPALGNRTMPLKQFAEAWDRIIFVVYRTGFRKPVLEAGLRAPVSDVIPAISRDFMSVPRLAGEF
ncbi:MAG: C39 family peptidase [Nitrospiraceae bacterium]|nr:C39 family peptidase [Nitrospiraceae bacterium]